MRVGDVLGGRYRLDARIGQGGFGVVWKAFDLRIERDVAVKVGYLEGDESARRFAQEARLAGNLAHANIAVIHDVGTVAQGDRPLLYLVMEFVPGETLDDVLARGLPPLDQALEWVAQICGALAAAHDAGIVHRDIKPANVMITPAGVVKVLDFGIAKHQGASVALTAENVIIGSPRYMAPERWNGGETDSRVDLYAVGCILMELCTGRVPFPGDNWQWLLAQHVSAAPPVPSGVRPGLPVEIDRLVPALLAKLPDDRPQHARLVEQQLRAIRAGLLASPAPAPVPAPLPVPGAPGRRSRRKKALTAGIALAAVAAGAVAATVLLHRGDAGGQGAAPPVSTHRPPSAASGSPTMSTPTTTSASASASVPAQEVPATPSARDTTPSPTRTLLPKRPPPALPPGWIRYVNANSSLCLAVPGASTNDAEELTQGDCAQLYLWRLRKEQTSDGTTWYSVRKQDSGQCLSVDAARTEDGAPATQFPCGLYPDQLWSLKYRSDQHGWQIRNRNSGKCLTVQDGSTAAGAPVVQRGCDGGDDQAWRL
jgi:serine/threonine protein kinase